MVKSGSIVIKARDFAFLAHEGQTRVNKGKTPMHVHFCGVADLVILARGSDIEIAAAYLHDVVEDTDKTIEDIYREFGEEVARVVYGLTDTPEITKLHTKERKRAQAIRVRDESDSVKIVKIADQISNVWDVATDPPENWSRDKCLDYINGALLIVEECKAASRFLYSKFLIAYREAIRKYGVQ